jgi:hypothetical protein
MVAQSERGNAAPATGGATGGAIDEGRMDEDSGDGRQAAGQSPAKMKECADQQLQVTQYARDFK